MDITTSIREHHGTEVLQEYRTYEKKMISLKKLNNQLCFLSDCVKEQVVPTSYGHIGNPSFNGDPFPKYVEHFFWTA